MTPGSLVTDLDVCVVSGLRMAYRRSGSGPSVLLIHGIMQIEESDWTASQIAGFLGGVSE